MIYDEVFRKKSKSQIDKLEEEIKVLQEQIDEKKQLCEEFKSMLWPEYNDTYYMDFVHDTKWQTDDTSYEMIVFSNIEMSSVPIIVDGVAPLFL